MKIDLGKLTEEKSEFKFSFEDEWVIDLSKKLDGEVFDLVPPFDLRLDVIRPCAQENTFVVNGVIEARLGVNCSRCLESFELSLKEEISFMTENRVENNALNQGKLSKDSVENKLENDDINTIFVTNNILDLEKLLLEIIYLNLPYAFICKSDCKGLCSTCGFNRNRDVCKCEDKVTDSSPFAMLKKLQQ